MISEFLSNISLVQFGSFVGLLNGAYTLSTLLAPAKIKLFLGDSINIVIPPKEVADRFHIGCNFVNSRAKVGAVHHLEAIVVDPQKQKWRFRWNLFFEYAQGATHVQKKTDPFPIAVLPRNSALHFIEFKLVEGEKIEFWPQGRYEFKIIGWANRRNRKSRPNMMATFHIEIDHLGSMQLGGTGQPDNVTFRFPILEWALQDTPNKKALV
ncbi:MAG: hypothetical protein Q8S00_17205 [Deltaproteobacteria bacterium]|nr:hypothetical protein [Deltaproteobacteria bacterium]